MKDLGLLGSDTMADPFWVNNLGQVVGGSCSATGNCRAFLWEGKTLIDLNTLYSGG